MTEPVLYSFRRCPYAIRARLAIVAAGKRLVLREVKLAEKPKAFLEASPSQTVPTLDLGDAVLDESLEIMAWAVQDNGHSAWSLPDQQNAALIAQNDGPFKYHLDRAKYAAHYPQEDAGAHYKAACGFLEMLEERLEKGAMNYARMDYTQAAILPFVRQFAFIDKARFDGLALPLVQSWLARFLESQAFKMAMVRYAVWHPNAEIECFPPPDAT